MTDAGPFDIGDEVTLAVDFKDAAGAAADPIAVELKIKDPAGVVTTFTTGQLDHPAAGRYEHKLVIDQPTRWYFRFTGTGGVTVAEERAFGVRSSVF